MNRHQIAEICEAYACGKGIRFLARSYGCGERAIRHLLSTNGQQIRRKGGVKGCSPKIDTSRIARRTAEAVRRLEAGLSVENTMIALRMSKATLRRYLAAIDRLDLIRPPEKARRSPSTGSNEARLEKDTPLKLECDEAIQRARALVILRDPNESSTRKRQAAAVLRRIGMPKIDYAAIGCSAALCVEV